MAQVLFYIGDDRYALECRQVIEIVPRVALRRVPRAPHAVAGLMNYRGAAVPVIDVCRLMLDRPCMQQLSSRIIIVPYHGTDSREHMLGLMVERVLETLQQRNVVTADPGISVTEAPYLGKIAVEKGSMTQLLRIDDLLPQSLRELLFAGHADGP